LNSHFAKHSFDVTSSIEKSANQEDQPRRRSTTKSPKSTPLAKSNSKNHIEPANHVSSLLLREIMRDPHSGVSSVQPFLSTIDYLNTLSDLVLAIPACGAAIHRYKPTKEFHNAISGCPYPPQTAVSYILHKLIPQPRLNSDSIPMNDTDKAHRLQAYRKTKLSQAGARLIVCLVARSGELRRYVVEQIVFALSGGQLPNEKTTTIPPPQPESVDQDEDKMWAISSWGDLVAGLASPRSIIGSSVTSQDSNSTLSFPVVKLMLEHKVAHALMIAIERITLHHPMASSVASSIIRPLEIYTRGGVFTTVNEMQMREKEKSAKASKDSRRATLGPSQRSESDIYDLAQLHGGGSFDESAGHSNADDDDESIEEDSDDSSEIEVRLGNVDDSDGSSEEEDEFSDESEEEEEEEDESDGDDMDEDADSEPHYSDESEEEEEEEDLGESEEVERNFLYDANAEDEANNGLEQGAAGGNEVPDESMMEGWTRVENGGHAGLGRILLDMVQPQNLGRQHHLANGGFLMDAAETMLGNILRGDLGLSEIEDSLGIRVVRGDRGDGRGAALGLSAGLTSRTNPNGSTGTTIGSDGRPAVHQNGNAPSTSVFGNRGQVEAIPMDVVFGTSAALYVANDIDHDSYSGIPLSYDTNLFPEGVAAAASSIQSTQLLTGGGGPLVHPLIQSLTLPPATSINSVATLSSQREGRNSALQRNNGMSGSFIAGANGSIIQVNDRLQTINSADQASRRTNTSTFSIWADDGLPLDDFSATFGQALDSFLQDQASVQEREAQNNNSLQSQEGTSSNGEASDPPAEDMEDADTSPASQELQSETAEVSSAMAAGLRLTISQQASDHPPNPSIANDQTGNQNHSEDNYNAADEVMAEDRSAGEDADELAVEDETNTDAGSQFILGAVAEPHESNREEEEEKVDDGTPEENVTNDIEGGQQQRCPPGIDPDVFDSLPLEVQQEIIQQHEVDAQISESGLDPEALAALPEEMRREVIEQEQQQQRLRELQTAQAADPANAEEYLESNASFLASLSPDLREEILLTADDAFISSLPSTLIAEANVLRERVASRHRQRAEEANAVNAIGLGAAGVRPGAARQAQQTSNPSRERRQRNGKLRIEKDIVWMENSPPLLTTQSTVAFLSLLYLLIPIQPQRVMHKLMLNLCLCGQSRSLLLNVLISLLSNDKKSVLALLEKLDVGREKDARYQSVLAAFPPSGLIGSTVGLVEDQSSRHITGSLRKRQVSNSAVTVAASLPASACGSSHGDDSVPPVVSRRIISCFSSMCKASPRVAFSMLLKADDGVDENRSPKASCLDKLLDLLELNQYSQSASNLEQLFSLLEIVVAPMSLLPKEDQEVDVVERSSPGREWVKVPRLIISRGRLHLLINILSLESFKDSSFLKISTLLRRLCRVEENRECILDELALVAESLGKAAILDLKSVSVRLSVAAKLHGENVPGNDGGHLAQVSGTTVDKDLVAGTPSSAVSLSTGNSELKLLR
jgi:hypothetical protein